MSPSRIYLHGMIVHSTIHRLAHDYPQADGYGEIAETHVVPGGETGNSALVLRHWGHAVKVAGPFLGLATERGVRSFLTDRGIDCTRLVRDDTFEGVRDIVFVGKTSRTVFGHFEAYYAGTKRWSPAERADIAEADAVGLDPYFGGETDDAARLCRELGKPYVTIDCAPGSELHRGAAATVVSGEYIRNNFASSDREDLLRRYTSDAPGLVVFTSGSGEILFARRGGVTGRVQPARIEPKSTLGAGDTFRGGMIHALAAGFDDAAAVRFAAATATSVCRRFPFALDPPDLAEITALADTLPCRVS